MINRIIELSEGPTSLNVDTGRLAIRRIEGPTTYIPIAEIAVVVCSLPAVTFTHSVLSELAQNGALLLVCDGKRLPSGMLIPVAAHHLQAELFRFQIAASEPSRKRVWQQIVRNKIQSQARTLKRLHGDDGGLGELPKLVKSGDPDNVEGRAARRYWPLLFGDEPFIRDQDADNQNRLLNYGYMVTRAIIARAVCAAGLYPSFGLHHHNRYDSFALADDLMEPFRILTDRAVFHRWQTRESGAPFDRDDKTAVLSLILGRHEFYGESRTLFDIAARVATSLASVFRGTAKEILLPDL